MGTEYMEEYFKGILEDCEAHCLKALPGIKPTHRQGFFEACESFHEAFEAAKTAETDEDLVKAGKAQEKAMKKCVKAANKVFAKLDLTEHRSVQAFMLKGRIIVDAKPARLAEFCSQNVKNGKLIDHLFSETSLMKSMLTNGGAKDGNYGKPNTGRLIVLRKCQEWKTH